MKVKYIVYAGDEGVGAAVETPSFVWSDTPKREMETVDIIIGEMGGVPSELVMYTGVFE